MRWLVLLWVAAAALAVIGLCAGGDGWRERR